MKKFFTVIIFLFAVPILIHFSYLFDKTIFYFQAPKATETILKQPPKNDDIVLLPLDSRPPCLQFVRVLGDIANVNIVTPPENILDNYYAKANTQLLKNWLLKTTKNANFSIISIDMLLHGGLIASRNPTVDMQQVDKTLEFIKTLKHNNNQQIYAFSIIPRLLIPEDENTKLWQYHMMIYATKKDMYDTFGNPQDFERMQEMLNRIPPELIEKFNILYHNNNLINHQLAIFAKQDFLNKLTIGQDDGQPFGRPNANKHHMDSYIRQLNIEQKAHTAYGADELATLQFAYYLNTKRNFIPKVKVVYSTPNTKDLIMPYMPVSVEQTVLEKIKAIGAQVSEGENVDFFLFVHCADQDITSNQLKQSVTLIKELSSKKPLALVDLSYNFRQSETILGEFLKQNIPVASLISYAGWNTTSNSIGTALAQSSIFLGNLKTLAQEYHPYIYQKNFEFTIARVIDDWLYQKDVQDFTNKKLLWQDVNPYKLGQKHYLTQEQISYSITRRQESLFYKNLAIYPFYSDKENFYFLTDLKTKISLPWERTFEIQVDIATKVGYIKKQP